MRCGAHQKCLLFSYILLRPPFHRCLLAVFLPPGCCLVPDPQKVEGPTLGLGQNPLLPKGLCQFLLEGPESWSNVASLKAAVAAGARIQQRLILPGIRPKQASLVVDQKGRGRRRPRVLSRPEVVDGLDAGEEPVLKGFGGKGRCAEISAEDVELEVVKDDGSVGDLIRECLHVGKFLSAGDQDDVEVGSFDGLDGLTAGLGGIVAHAKEVQKGLFGLDEPLVPGLAPAERRDGHPRINVVGRLVDLVPALSGEPLDGDRLFVLVGQQDGNLPDAVPAGGDHAPGKLHRQLQVGLGDVVGRDVVEFQNRRRERREFDLQEFLVVDNGTVGCRQTVLLELEKRGGRRELGGVVFGGNNVVAGRGRDVEQG
mmetsp:Transcript_6175/g.17596  ORF Transcript_6175/g.17596 Transcript_6175/m.17596 type:complete len:369 (+) Transcript_6175:825-1931(+)